MKTLLYIRPDIKITASGVSLRINNDNFVIQDFDKISNIMITAKSGYISIYALRLLSLKRITLTLHNLNGEIIYHVIPDYPNQNLDNRILQFTQYLKNKELIANKIVKIKKENYQKLLTSYNMELLTSDIEAVFSNEYFARYQKLINEYGYEYTGRKGFYYASNQKAINIVNAVMNFYYGLIEHRLLTQICYYGYDYNISFLHIPQYNKLPLTYDLIELLRADIDNIILKLAKDRVIQKRDFTLTDDGYYLIKEGKINKYLKQIKPIENKTENVLKSFTAILNTTG